ncbi:MAG: hypothetical protein JO051_00800 [Acidobacteriaceae bacterium]|jgi:hypothetical protein|nr:hypothetical protein [Acidobacteriaceae bacterium]
MAKRKEKVTEADIAAVNFEPLPSETLKRLEVSNEQWLAHLFVIRAAFVALSKTKEELKELARKAQPTEEKLDDALEGFDKSINFLSADVEFLSGACKQADLDTLRKGRLSGRPFSFCGLPVVIAQRWKQFNPSES